MLNLIFAATNSIAATGDENPILIWIIIAAVALLAIIAAIILVIVSRKKGAKKPVKAAATAAGTDADMQAEDTAAPMGTEEDAAKKVFKLDEPEK